MVKFLGVVFFIKSSVSFKVVIILVSGNFVKIEKKNLNLEVDKLYV